jgi:hypothetical protein
MIGPLAESLSTLLGATDSVVVSGHSLGGPLGTYLTLDLARSSVAGRVSGCFFASPHPGNQAFAALFDDVVRDNYVVYNYVLDVVPWVPPTEFGYCALSNVKIIQPASAQADIRVGVGCSHHVVCYLAMLDYAATMAAITPVPAGEKDSADCILGPQTGQPSLAKSLFSRIVEVARAQ